MMERIVMYSQKQKEKDMREVCELKKLCPVCGKPWTAKLTIDNKVGYVLHGSEDGCMCHLTKRQIMKALQDHHQSDTS